MTTKLKLVNKLVEILPQDDTTTYPRLNFNLVNGTYSVPISTENPDDGSIASFYKIGNFIYYIPKTIGPKPLVLTDSCYKMSDVYPSTYQIMTTIPDILDTSKVTNMENMFKGCTNLTTIPQLDTSKVTNMENMFKGCTSLLATFPWTIDCSSITNTWNMSGIFAGTSVTAVTLLAPDTEDNFEPSSWDLTDYERDDLVITIIRPLTYKMNSIYPTTYQTITNIDINTIKSEHPGLLDNLTTTGYMFGECNNLTSISNINTLDTSNVTNMSSMFANCSKLTTISQLTTSNVTNMNNMFAGCSSLTSIPSLDTSSVTNMNNMFKGCTSLTAVPQLNTSNVTNMQGTFAGSGIVTGDLSSFNTSKVTNMQETFHNCYSLTSLNLSGVNTNNVTTMQGMFSCFFNSAKLTTLNLSSFNTSKVTNMQEMFSGSSSLTTITVGSNWTTANVTNMKDMFAGCTSLTAVPQLNTSNVTNMQGMFSNCKALTAVPQLNTSNVTNMYCMFRGASSLPATFPWVIDCSSITTVFGLDELFSSTPVTKVTLRNVNSSIRSQITSNTLKRDNTLTINFA